MAPLGTLVFIILLTEGRSLDFQGIDSMPRELYSYKVWRRDSALTSKEHWASGRPPCAGDRLVFPKDLRGVSAYVGVGSTPALEHEGQESSPVQVREVLLPWDGELVLPEGTSLVVEGEAARNKDCPGADALWRADPPPFWLDPANWWDPAVLASDSEAVPHLMRIPCGQDIAYIGHQAFHIMMPEFKVPVGALYVDQGQGLVLADQADDVLEQLDDRLFSPRPWLRTSELLHVSAATPADLRGHLCGLGWQDPQYPQAGEARDAARRELEQAACRHVTCPVPACSRPLRPHLHCCFICGGVLEVTHSSSLDVVKVAVSNVERNSFPAPAVHVGVVPASVDQPELVQVVVIGDAIDGFVALLQEKLGDAARGAAVQLTRSGPRAAPATTASVFVTLIGTLFLVLAGLTLLVYAKQRPTQQIWSQQSPASFLFARFENAAGDVDPDQDGSAGGVVEVKLPAKTVMSARGSWSARSFRNPLYEQEQQPEEEVMSQSLQKVLQENVSFAELQARQNSQEETLSSEDSERTPQSSESDNKLVDITL